MKAPITLMTCPAKGSRQLCANRCRCGTFVASLYESMATRYLRWLGIVLCSVSFLAIPRLASAQDPPSGNESGTAWSYAVPLIDIVGFDFLVNRFGERHIDYDTYNVTGLSIRRNFTHKWVVDSDPFATNQFLHPYQGAMYHGFARSAGLNYWRSLAYTFAGSALWEVAGETTPPSINDQIASGIGGTFLGEPLFRIANLIFERSTLPRFWQELLGLAISPSTEFNRTVYGDRFRGVFSSRDALVASELQFGAMGTSSIRKDNFQPLTRNEGVMAFSIDYGMPGRKSYTYDRPFDYFSLEFGASSANLFEHIFSRGLLTGRSYGDESPSHRGVWGLYGSYDYVAPQIFRMSSVALSLGDTSERKLPKSIALQSTFLGGVGYGAAGSVGGSDQTDYHYGVTPQILGAVRVIWGDRTAGEVTLRDYYVSRLASPMNRGAENNTRVDATVTQRLIGDHAVSLKYIWSQRSATFSNTASLLQSRGSFGFFYTYLGSTRFGAAPR
jgi:Domain of unknown function (DUF3943)